jgi:four helix bundle protein
LPKNPTNLNVCNQLIRSATSIGANYREANESETKKDFKNKVCISRKEAKETIYWLELLMEANPELVKNIEPLKKESNELLKIFATIVIKCR